MTALLDRIPQPVFRLLSFLMITILLIMMLFPLYFMVTTAFKTEGEIYSELTWLPREPNVEQISAIRSSTFASRSICATR